MNHNGWTILISDMVGNTLWLEYVLKRHYSECLLWCVCFKLFLTILRDLRVSVRHILSRRWINVDQHTVGDAWRAVTKKSIIFQIDTSTTLLHII